MIICPNCQKQLPDGANFCDGCGTQFQQAVICPSCGNQTSAAQPFCQVCGAQFATQAPAAEKKAGFNLDAIKNLPKKTLGIIGGAVVGVIALVIILAIVLSSGMPNYAIYTKDDVLCYNDLGDNKTGIEIDDKASFALLSSDGKTMFFQKEGNIYYRNINKKNAEAEKFLSNVYLDSCFISENGKIFTYIKDGDLYQKKLGSDEATKIAKEVSDFTVTPNGGKVLYVTNESDVYYVKKVGKDPVRVVGGVDEYGIKHISEDLKTILYVKENSLYSVVAGKDSNKIASDVSSVYAADFKNIYYTTKEEIKEGEVVKEIKYTLNFYNGKESFKLAKDNFNRVEKYNFKKGNALVYSTIEKNKTDNSSSITIEYFLALGKETYSFFEYTEKTTDGKTESHDYITDITLTEDGKKLYYIVKNYNPDAEKAEKPEPAVGDLYEASANKKVASGKVIDNDVYDLSSYTAYLNKPVYTKEYNEEKRTEDLYFNKKLVSSDVVFFSYLEAAKGFVFEADDSLYFYKNKKVLITNEEYGDAAILPTGDILFLIDISETSGKGELMLFNGKKSKKIDSDVSSIQEIGYLEQRYEDNRHLNITAPGVPKAETPVIDQY